MNAVLSKSASYLPFLAVLLAALCFRSLNSPFFYVFLVATLGITACFFAFKSSDTRQQHYSTLITVTAAILAVVAAGLKFAI
jgi:hypothetical protein